MYTIPYSESKSTLKPDAYTPDILICGMHRSGTSLTGKFFENLGYEFGNSSDLLAARDFNKEGFWERKDVIELNDKILSLFGGSWDYPVMPKKDVLKDLASKNLYNFADKAREIVSKLNKPFAIKDPRLSLLLAFWDEIIKDSKIIIVVRNPIEVANSLRKRNYVSITFGLMLWLRYYQAVLSYTQKSERFFLFNDSLLKADDNLIKTLSEYLGLSDFNNVKNALHKSINPSLVNSGGAPDPEKLLKSPHHKELLRLWDFMKLEAGY